MYEPGVAKTDADGRFSWKPDPTPPFEVLVILPSGQLTKPILITNFYRAYNPPDWADRVIGFRVARDM